MHWFIRMPYLLYSEINELSNNGNYNLVANITNRTLVSSGEIIVRLKKCYRFPVVIVYPDATPYIPPVAYLLNETIDSENVQQLSKLSPDKIADRLKSKIRFYYHRHQNPDGSLCILDAEDLHNERPEIIGAQALIGRLRQWFRGVKNGKFPMDSREVELFHHFPNRVYSLKFLLPDEFFRPDILGGKFYLGVFTLIPSCKDVTRLYFGLGVDGKSRNGLTLSSFVNSNESLFFSSGLPNPISLATRDEKVVELKAKGDLIEGYWWQIDEEPFPFGSVRDFATYIDSENGLEQVAQELKQDLRYSKDLIFIAFRFFDRNGHLQWQFFQLSKSALEPAILVDISIDEAIQILLNRKIEAISAELFTDEYFHSRNSIRANRSLLKDKSVTIVGSGALGSAVTDNLAKGGIGNLDIVDKDVLNAHNVVRHNCGLQNVGWPKSMAVTYHSVFHNPFIKARYKIVNILNTPIDKYFHYNSIGISTIADDNIEGYLNELSVISGRTVFYARALRGAKAARIFRVKPGVDACKECLIHYLNENSNVFKIIPEDPELPIITNECNNPVRPASGADINLIAGIISRVVIDSLQASSDQYNHWIWHTENIPPDLRLERNELSSLKGQFIKPHSKCRLCQRIEPKEVFITEEAIDKMKYEAKNAGRVETGGILIGYRSETGNLVVIEATEPGPNAVCTESRFERDIEYCQKKLTESSIRLGLKGQYVGEWHFHPKIGNQPSIRDIRSLSEIANQINYATDEPLMIILSPEYELGFTLHPTGKDYRSTSHKVIDRETIILTKCQVI